MMKKNILIKNGVVVDPIFKTQEQRDVYIQSGRIASAKNFTGADNLLSMLQEIWLFPVDRFPQSCFCGRDRDRNRT